jgi:uncharacterized membrane protein/thiol-disulfide isomerase/thioredoxin
MKRYTFLIASFLLVSLLVLPMTSVHAQTTSVVRAVLFYSPTCGHCQYVITEVLPPLLEKYGEQLQIVGVDVTQPNGQTLFMAALQKFNVEQVSVPFLVIGDRYLMGSVDIPEKFPGMIETYLAGSGVDWPDIPGLREALALSAETGTSTTAAPTQSTTHQTTPVLATVSPSFASPVATPGILPTAYSTPNWRDNLARDPAGNALAILVLIGMLAAVVWAILLFKKANGISAQWGLSIPVLCIIGLGVAGYLAYVEATQVTAVCGPVGDCNTVQQSEYARLFGILSIGMLGLIGYEAIIIAWLVARFTTGRLADLAGLSLLVMSSFGTLFSIYLTFLEPFVIGATCAWCLTSAILITVLMLLSVRPAKLALSRFQ